MGPGWGVSIKGGWVKAQNVSKVVGGRGLWAQFSSLKAVMDGHLDIVLGEPINLLLQHPQK